MKKLKFIIGGCCAMLLTAACLLRQAPVAPRVTAYSTSTQQLKSNHLPNSIFQLVSLRSLTIRGADCDYQQYDKQGRRIVNCWMLTEIPSDIKKLKQLETLRLPLNAISTIPAELAELGKLTELDLTDNAGLTSIEAITKLIHLRKLYLYGCSLEKLPANIGDLKNLQQLGLAGNNLPSAEQVRIKKALPKCSVIF